MKKLIHFLLLSFLAGGVAAQSDVQYTHFTFNKLAFNPGYTGAKGSFDALALYRNQWSGIDGAPRTVHMNAHTPFAGQRNGMGIAVTADEIGKVSTNSAEMSYAYRIKLGESSTLSLGVSGRFEQLRIKWSEADAIDPDDPEIPQGDETAFAANFGTGAYFLGKKFYFGLSMPRLLKSPLYLDRSDRNDNPRTTYVTGGFSTSLNSNIELVPSMMLSYNPAAPVDVDLNANFIFMKTFWLGGSYRLGDSFDALAGMEFGNGLRLGVGLDFTQSELRKVTNGSWEIMLGYTFKCKSCDVSHLRFF
ncbi:MAG: type IX secretion system membrane protein PorP/SprF [Saprospiraceae bacterium]|nr:type IX secretion system membrane protein PorP/SprF [Saprospiraceae bacterium]